MRVYLRAFELEDYKNINRWHRDAEIADQTSGNVYFVSSEREKKWVEDKIFHDEKNLYLAICLEKNHEMIGYLSIIKIDWRNRQAEWGGLTIGRKDLWNQGYATESAQLMLKHVFFEMGLHRFYGCWLEEHVASMRMAEKLGFKKEGILRDSVFKNNKFHNQVLMSLLKEEFEAVFSREE
jgi:RimJ/RimL family protein N-acetyltransferase